METTKDNGYKWLVLLTVAVGTLMPTLDNSVLNVSFPRLTRVFETEASVVMWLNVIYFLICVSLMLTFGRIGDTFGRKRVYILGFGLHTLGLVICALSQTIAHLILGRAVQGVGAAMVVGLSNAIATATFPAAERGKVLGILAAVVSTGMLTGPAVGGFILDALDWRAIFYIRVPVGIAGMIMAKIVLKEQKSTTAHLKFDLGGAAALFSTLSCLLLFFDVGGRLGFTSPQVAVLGLGMAVSLVIFAMLERRTSQGILDLNLFKSRLFSAGSASLVIMYLGQAAMTFLGPFYLIDGLGFSASKAGLFVAVIPFTALIVAPFSGSFSDKAGYRTLCTLGISLVGLGLFLLSRLGADADPADLLPRLVLLGVGQGLFLSPNASSIMGSVSSDRLSTASAMIATSRQVGLSSGIAIAGTIFVGRQMLYATELAHSADPLAVQRLSVINGFQDTLLIAAIICSIGILTSLARGKRR